MTISREELELEIEDGFVEFAQSSELWKKSGIFEDDKWSISEYEVYLSMLRTGSGIYRLMKLYSEHFPESDRFKDEEEQLRNGLNSHEGNMVYHIYQSRKSLKILLDKFERKNKKDRKDTKD